MNAYIPPSWMTGHIGCTRGPPSRRTVARNPSPTPNWYSSARPAVARSGRSVENSAQEATAPQSAPAPNSGQRWPPVRLRATAITALALIAVILIAFVVQIARGQSGWPYSMLGFWGCVPYVAAVIVLRVRG